MPNTLTRKVTHLVIDRNKWGTNSLLKEDGTMCCLGFLAIKCGACEDEILEEGSPEHVPNLNWPPALLKLKAADCECRDCKSVTDSALTDKIVNINDSETLSWAAKERKLIPLFAEVGIKLSFRGPAKKDQEDR